MKNDIDSILDSMFRDGKLNFGAAKRRNEQTQQALESVQETGDSLSRSLQSSIAQLTQEAKADMQALDQRLQADGLKKDVPAGNSGNPEQTDAAFQTAEEETARKVLGQKEFVSAVALAFRASLRGRVSARKCPWAELRFWESREPAGTVRWRL